MAISTGFNEFKEAFRDFVIADLLVADLIGNNFFSQDLATLFEPTFPLATFTSLSGPDNIFIQQFDLTVRAYSNQHYFEAHEVYDAIRRVIGCRTIQPRIITRIVSNPTEDFDEISRLFSVAARFRITRILSRDQIITD